MTVMTQHSDSAGPRSARWRPRSPAMAAATRRRCPTPPRTAGRAGRAGAGVRERRVVRDERETETEREQAPEQLPVHGDRIGRTKSRPAVGEAVRRTGRSRSTRTRPTRSPMTSTDGEDHRASDRRGVTTSSDSIGWPRSDVDVPEMATAIAEHGHALDDAADPARQFEIGREQVGQHRRAAGTSIASRWPVRTMGSRRLLSMLLTTARSRKPGTPRWSAPPSRNDGVEREVAQRVGDVEQSTITVIRSMRRPERAADDLGPERCAVGHLGPQLSAAACADRAGTRLGRPGQPPCAHQLALAGHAAASATASPERQDQPHQLYADEADRPDRGRPFHRDVEWRLHQRRERRGHPQHRRDMPGQESQRKVESAEQGGRQRPGDLRAATVEQPDTMWRSPRTGRRSRSRPGERHGDGEQRICGH